MEDVASGNWKIVDGWLEREGEVPIGDIQDSIDKWSFLAENYTPDMYIRFNDTCSLCKAYVEDECFGCPVYDHTGYIFCRNTPYEDMWELYEKTQYYGAQDRDMLIENGRSIARREVDFLKMLASGEGTEDDQE